VTASVVAVLGYAGVDDLDLVGVHAVLAKGGLPVRIVAGPPTFPTSGGLILAAGAGLDALATATAVVVPGGRGAATAATDPAIQTALAGALRSGARMYGVCTGSLILAAAGLAGHRLAVHGAKRDLLRGLGVAEIGVGLVRSGPVCTVGGDRRASVKSVDLGFEILADLAPHMVAEVQARMELDPGRVASEAAA
jgi:putative intracellular protease/amidase